TTGLGYPDLHRHILALAERNRLFIVDRPTNKDTEMHPLVRWQFRGGLPERERKAFLFTHPIDSRGRRFQGATLVAGLAGNREIYAIGMGMPVEDIGAAWVRAIAGPLKPVLVDDAICHDVVLTGEALRVAGASLDSMPVPISSPGWDNGAYLTAGHFITRDPETGIQNVGNYRGQIKGPLRVGMNPSIEQRAGIYPHWLKYKARGEKMPTAIVVGCPPAISYCSVQKVPEDVDELAVAGALVGTPICVTRAKSVDLLVPAESEWVIEGFIDTEYLEPEAPFGESHGYVNLCEYNAFMEVTAITRRNNPVLPSFISQVTPSESSTIKRVAYEPLFLHHLQRTLGIRGVKRVSMHEPLTGVLVLIVLVIERGMAETEVWRALYGASSLHRFAGRWVVAVNEDIDPENSDAVLWAMCYRAQAQHDLKVLDRKDPGHGPRGLRDGGEAASVLVNATLRGNYPPVALPAREFMERARVLWTELGLPDFVPQSPWHGYSLGFWPPHLAEQARMATDGDSFALDERLRQQRRSDVEMNRPFDEP
ncbi:MAG: UbiD family decarboxylase, partial [Xanthobacteraceae bacterium]